MAEAGRPTDLTEELFAKIKEQVLEGKNLREIAQHCEIPESTLYTWTYKNYLNISDKIEGWKRDRKLMLAEKNIVELLQIETKNNRINNKGESVEFNDSALVRVKADMSKFVAETLGKDNYSKRSELTGKNGDALKLDVTKASDEDLIRLVAGENTSRS